MKKLSKSGFFAFFISLLILFCYFRLKPIYFQTVPYTYDQGRDFLKTAEIIQTKHLTFLGPTTGLPGLFHGVWWYYFLIIPYLIFQGSPLGFYFFIFLVSLFQVILFSFFLKKEFDRFTSLFFLLIVTSSPYFIQLSFFPISSFLALPFIFFLCYTTFQIFKKGDLKFIFLSFLSLGFILEAELPVGFFIIPSYLLSIFATRNIKNFFGDIRKIGLAFLGLSIAIVPRLLFELKNNFLQTRVFFRFFLNPSKTNIVTFKGIFFDRINTFTDYYLKLFPEFPLFLGGLILFFAIVGTVYGMRFLNKHQKKYIVFLTSQILIVFLLTLLYRNNFFWQNYLEGFPIFYLTFLSIGFYLLQKVKNNLLRHTSLLVFVVLLAITAMHLTKEISSSTIMNTGMREQVTAVNYIYNLSGTKTPCIRIYTPPIIPYTYQYLFDYYSSWGKPKISHDFQNEKCWYIMEKEQEGDRFQARVVKWRTEHIPENAIQLSRKKISERITVEYWRTK